MQYYDLQTIIVSNYQYVLKLKKIHRKFKVKSILTRNTHTKQKQ